MKFIKLSIMIGLVLTGLTACEKDEFGPLTDVRPAVPVEVVNASDFRPGPTVTASRATNTFAITLEIPESSGRTIKEITKVVASAGTSQPLFGATGLYTAGPIAGSGRRVTLNTSLTEYASKPGNAIPANNPPINAVELAKQFYFLITLDNNETIISQQVRVLVVP
jgi:hypothetical protein